MNHLYKSLKDAIGHGIVAPLEREGGIKNAWEKYDIMSLADEVLVREGENWKLMDFEKEGTTLKEVATCFLILNEDDAVEFTCARCGFRYVTMPGEIYDCDWGWENEPNWWEYREYDSKCELVCGYCVDELEAEQGKEG